MSAELSWSFVHSIFFFAFGYHRYLHSFPTRRSSDLGVPLAEETSALKHEVGRLVRAMYGRRSEEHTSDSSHSQISYAVFCLKKKSGLPCVYITSPSSTTCCIVPRKFQRS